MKCSGNYVLEITLWNFQQFFTKLGTVEAKSLQLTKQMLEKRQQLEMVIQGLQQKINTGLSKINELQQEEAILEKHELDILANKDFSYEAKISKMKSAFALNTISLVTTPVLTLLAKTSTTVLLWSTKVIHIRPNILLFFSHL